MTKSKLFILLLFIFAQLSTHSQTLAAEWVEKSDVSGERNEWRVILPEEINLAINNWISNQREGTHLAPSTNPFDPDQVDISGVVMGEGLPESGEPVYGFYYEGYSRDISSTDKNQWDWKASPAESGFRIRWSAPAPGKYTIKVSCAIPGNPRYESPTLQFEINQRGVNKEFIGVSDNGHYFVRKGSGALQGKADTVFIPVGKNVWEGAFDCGCNIPCVPEHMLPQGKTYPCESCYQLAEDDICCGLSVINRMNRCKPWTPEKSVREMCLPLASYLKLENVLKQMARSGANTIRFPIYQSSFDIEFEKINNYLDRQYQAWEFDRLIETCENLDLRIQLNMGIQTPYQNHPYGLVNWDWYDTNICDEAGKSQSWCYRHDLNLEKPYDFFESTEARRFYKKKLRYFIARWGYSSRIILIELLSEMNGAGSGTIYNHSQDGCTWWNKPKHLPLPYDTDMRNRETLESWNLEMMDYIRNDLKHSRHLISVDYTGKGPMSRGSEPNSDPCNSTESDNTWDSPLTDVYCWNNYGAGATRFRGFAVDEYGTGKNPGFNCNRTANGEFITGFKNTTKPVVYGENGFGDHIMACDYTGFVKELLALPFTGHASSGMSWDEITDTTHWQWMGHVRRFIDRQVTPFAGIGHDEWTPDYTNSENGGTSMVETVFLKNSERGNKRLVGVLMNRSWNWYTTGKEGACIQLPDESIIPSFMKVLKSASFDDEPIKISRMEGLKKYSIQYFDPVTGEVLKTEIRGTFSGRLSLTEYPELTASRPAVFYTIERLKNRPDRD